MSQRDEVLAWMKATGAGAKVASVRFGVPLGTIKSWRHREGATADEGASAAATADDTVGNDATAGLQSKGATADQSAAGQVAAAASAATAATSAATAKKKKPKPPDENDKLRAGKLPENPDADEVLVTGPPAEPPPKDDGTLPPTPPVEAYADLDPAKPIIAKFPGAAVVFVRTNDGLYVPSDEHLVHVELEHHQPHIPRFKKGEKGKSTPLGLKELVQKYGRRADTLVYDLTGTESLGYVPNDDGGGTVFLPAAKLDTRVTPKFDDRVAHWLKLLGGDKPEKLLDWLATFRDLRYPTAAVYLQGVGEAGKGMFAAACAQCWGASVTSYNDIFGTAFNSALKHGPVVFLDEGVSTKDKSSSMAFRSLIGEVRHAISEKKRPTATLKGAVRLVIAANGPDALRIREDLTIEDEDAIGQRILHINVDPEAKKYLQAIGGRAATRDWVVDDAGMPGRIVRHIAWLAENRTVVPGSRFLVQGDSATWVRTAGLRGGLKQKCLVAVARSLAGLDDTLDLERRPVHPNAKQHVALVNPERLQHRWERLTGEKNRVPDLGELGRALAGLSAGERQRPRLGIRNGKDIRAWCWPIDAAKVVEAAEMFGIGDANTIREKLGQQLLDGQGGPDLMPPPQAQQHQGPPDEEDKWWDK